MSTQKTSNQFMPVIFLGHGSPMNAINDNDFTQTLTALGQNLPKPKAILMVSAHWETNGSWLTGMDTPKTIHDFYGFPQALFDIKYPAPGAPDLAKTLSNKLNSMNIKIDLEEWGLDHGTWSVLKHMYPMANIPILQLSLDKTKSLNFHFELGKQLNYLRKQGILIIGSGNIVHNLKELNWKEDAQAHTWAIKFDAWVKKQLLERNFNALVASPLDTHAGKLSIPTLEHYLPLLYVLGASDPNDKLIFDFEGIQNSSISMRCVRFFKD